MDAARQGSRYTSGDGAQAEGEHHTAIHDLQGEEVMLLIVAAIVQQQTIGFPCGKTTSTWRGLELRSCGLRTS